MCNKRNQCEPQQQHQRTEGGQTNEASEWKSEEPKKCDMI